MITLTPGTVAVIELDNGPLNLVDVSAMEQLHAALDRVQDAPETRALVLAASGERAFCAGSAFCYSWRSS